MRQVLATDHGGGLYRRRKATVEPVFAQTKHNRKINSFQRRGRSAVRSEWQADNRHPQLTQAPQAPDSHRQGLRRPQAAAEPPDGPQTRPTQTTPRKIAAIASSNGAITATATL